MLTQTFPTENFCPEQILGSLTFLLTPIGHFAYSNEVCEEGTNNGETLPSLRQITRTPVPCEWHPVHNHGFYSAGKPRASARCIIRNGSPAFAEPQLLDCDQTLNDIQQNVGIKRKHLFEMIIFCVSKKVKTNQAGMKGSTFLLHFSSPAQRI